MAIVETQEEFVPVTEDFRQPDNDFDIIKGLELVQNEVRDFPIDPTLNGVLTIGQWGVLTDSGTLVEPGSTGVGNTYPVWSGSEQFDSLATGNATVIMGGNYQVRTSHYDTTQTYHAGSNLTVKNGFYPTLAGGSDAILARVVAIPDASGVITILVLNR
jgi:hypothetical protein